MQSDPISMDPSTAIRSQRAEPPSSERIPGIDFWRCAALLAVVVIHTYPRYYPQWQASLGSLVFVGIHMAARFAVPFFFIISGFLRYHVQSEEDGARKTLWRAGRLLLVALAYYAAYALLDPVSPAHWDSIRQLGFARTALTVYSHQLELLLHNPLARLSYGHLWFLYSLACAIVICHWLQRWLSTYHMLGLSIILYLVTCASNPSGYGRFFPLEVLQTAVNPLFSCAFYLAGIAMARTRWRPSKWQVWSIIMFGLICHISESLYLALHFGSRIYRHHAMLGTYPYAIGVAYLSIVQCPGKRSAPLRWIGRHSLHVYASHVFFLRMLKRLWPGDAPIIAAIVVPPIVLALSALYAGAITMLSRRVRQRIAQPAPSSDSHHC